MASWDAASMLYLVKSEKGIADVAICSDGDGQQACTGYRHDWHVHLVSCWGFSIVHDSLVSVVACGPPRIGRLPRCRLQSYVFW